MTRRIGLPVGLWLLNSGDFAGRTRGDRICHIDGTQHRDGPCDCAAFADRAERPTTPYQLPDGRIVQIQTELARGQAVISFTLASGTVVYAQRIIDGKDRA